MLEGLKQGSQVLKELQKEMSLETVERLMEQSAEGVAYQKVCPFPPLLAFFLFEAAED